MQLSFKKARSADFDYLLWLRKETMNPHLEKAGFSTNEENHLKALNYRFEGAKIIFLNNEVGLLKTSTGDNFIEIIQFQIAPKYQGKGLGMRIIAKLIAEAPENVDFLLLSVLKENNAKKLYEKAGFVVTEETPDSYIMRMGIDRKG